VPELVDGHALTRATIEALLERLSALPLAERRGVRGLMPERAPTIVAGTAIAAEVLRAAGADEFVVSERDILHGAALAAADRS
jgi:exopolyphosphatase / guanosine-5'-triphosphate,3'-diphosphate pyrophosphatase